MARKLGAPVSIRATHLVLACAVLLCGSGTAVAEAATRSGADLPMSVRLLTAPQAKAVAAAGVLRSSDLPGYGREKVVYNTATRNSEARFARCVGRKLGPYLARNFGYSYTKADTLIASSTYVARSRAAARADKTTMTSIRGRKCFLAQLEGELAGDGIRVASSMFTPISARISGADTTYGFVIDLALARGDQTVDIQMLVVTSNVGRAEVSLVVQSGLAPVSKAKALRLLAVAAKRVNRLDP